METRARVPVSTAHTAREQRGGKARGCERTFTFNLSQSLIVFITYNFIKLTVFLFDPKHFSSSKGYITNHQIAVYLKLLLYYPTIITYFTYKVHVSCS